MLGEAEFVTSVLQLAPAGVAIGLLAAAPIGPVNIFVIHRTLARGFWGGLAAGLGAVLGDGLICALAAFGFSAAEDVLAKHTRLIQLIGGAVLAAFGLRLFLSRKSQPAEPHVPRLIDDMGVIPQTFFMTVTNPGAILGLFAVIGGLSSAVGGFVTIVQPIVLLTAITAGNFLWWFGLTRLIASIHHKLSPKNLSMINRISATLLLASGIALLAHLAATALGWKLPLPV